MIAVDRNKAPYGGRDRCEPLNGNRYKPTGRMSVSHITSVRLSLLRVRRKLGVWLKSQVKSFAIARLVQLPRHCH